MRLNKFSTALLAALAIAAITFTQAVSALAQTESVLYRFTPGGSSGQTPLAGVIFDKSGNLYGTTSSGGGGFGTVYRLSPTSSGLWKETTLHVFKNVANGATPIGGLTFDSRGNLVHLPASRMGPFPVG